MSKTVQKALRILELTVTSETPISASEVASVCDLTKSNAHRLLKVLEHEGYLIQSNDSKLFSPSLKVWEFGNSVLSRKRFIDAAQTELHWLAHETGEAIHLAIYDNQEAVTVSQIDSRHAVRAYTETGGRAKAYAVATGKAMLAYASAAEIDSICGSLEQITPRTLTQPALLRDQLERVRQTRVAINNEEWRLGVRGLATPILDSSGQCQVSIGICGPSARVSPDLDDMHGKLLVRAARKLSRRLGLSPQELPYLTKAV